MKKLRPRETKPDTARHPQDKPGGKCSHRLSKALPGEKEPPADRGACEKETQVQGSE